MQENAMARKLSRWYNTSKKINQERRKEIRESMQDVLGFLVFCSFGYQKGR
jgi:hypothetical protein